MLYDFQVSMICSSKLIVLSYLISLTGTRAFVLTKMELTICDSLFFMSLILSLIVLYTKLRNNGCLSLHTIDILNIISSMILISANLVALLNISGQRFSSK